MRRLFVIAVFLLVAPAAVEAQPRMMVGGGFTAPSSDLSNTAEPGYHLMAAIQVGIPTLPVSFRGDGAFHRMSSPDVDMVGARVLAGSLSLVFTLPGVGLQPYLLGGIGSYRVETGPTDLTTAVTKNGYHGGFGVVVGGLGFGAFAEVRFIQINTDSKARMIPLTLGIRL
jgi:hypothetical protein